MTSQKNIFSGCMPALMTPCNSKGIPDFNALVSTGKSLIQEGMDAVIYCGSMGDWPLLTDEQRCKGVESLCQNNIPTIVGTGAQNTERAAAISAHASAQGATGLMVIPRVMSRGSSSQAQYFHFKEILSAAPDLPAVIYNSPYYGFETKADLFFKLRDEHSNLVGFKEFGGSHSLSYAAEHITGTDDDLSLMIGVDTQVFHGYVNCGAKGAITGVGNALPVQVLRLVELCKRAARGDAQARVLAKQLDDALHVLATFDEGPDLVLYYKHLMVLEGHQEYTHQIYAQDYLSASQKTFIEQQWSLFKAWWASWPGAVD
ncbi:dihydrodipicolinate synthase family protein [Temperatibacter marinus]|uniref:Dihydrodipicolinate synthase family protein n=1 Tax=Temperatibacter marinus TaxID=1456591 RepID=A0AA52EHQ0_9PROT|nr:dihydrodipicolinate synthase family protein [Temperatibacter marinus]WND03853.1 dihydrodipicolinate synthase family protein [Temperatibacter marinus]